MPNSGFHDPSSIDSVLTRIETNQLNMEKKLDGHIADTKAAWGKIGDKFVAVDAHIANTDSNVETLKRESEKSDAVSKVKFGFLGALFTLIGGGIVEGWSHLFGNGGPK